MEPLPVQPDPEGERPDSTWCVVANVVEEQPYGPRGAETRRGTKHFSPGTKLYVLPRRLGIYEPRSGQQIVVLGRHRGRGNRLVQMILNAHAVTNWRAKVVYDPLALRLIREEGYTGDYWPPWTEEGARAYVEQMQERERERRATSARRRDTPPALVPGAPPPPRPSDVMPSPTWQTGYVDANGLSVYYKVHGNLTSGTTPLLVLHGSFMVVEAMAPLVERFAATRPVIVIDQRGHGRTGDAPGPITYGGLADDAAGVLDALDVATADVLGYSMGGTVAVGMAVRHPDRVGKLVILSAPARPDGWHPAVRNAVEQWTPEAFAGSPLQAAHERLSPTPDAFPSIVERMRAMEGQPYGWSEDNVRAIGCRTMIVVGDSDGVTLEHAVALFRLRGGADTDAAAKGFISGVPRARLAILPATSHVGMMARAQLIADLVTPFLDDALPPTAEGFF